MTEDEIRTLIREKLADGRLPCHRPGEPCSGAWGNPCKWELLRRSSN